MKAYSTLAIVLFFLALPAFAQPIKPKIFIAPAEGFESYLAAGFTKKEVPAEIVTDESKADFVLRATPVDQHPESTGSKVARCLFLYCIGMEGTHTVSIQLVNAQSQSVVWAYNVRKAGDHNFQSSAEACAKHLKSWLIHNLK